MSLFRCGFTVQKKKVTERPNNSDASEEIQPAVRSTFQAKKVLPWAMSNSCRGIVRCELGESSLDWRFLGYLAARKRGKYQHYSAEKRAKIGRYASENGNSKAINHFKEELPTLRESTVRTFKQAYQKRLREEKKKGNTDVTVIATLSDTRGRPSILRELDSKIISLLKSIRSSGEVINFCVKKEKALALVDSNKTPYLIENLSLQWLGWSPFIGTAILPAELEQPLVLQFPEGCLKNVNLHFSLTLTRWLQRTRFLLSWCFADQTPCSSVRFRRENE